MQRQPVYRDVLSGKKFVRYQSDSTGAQPRIGPRIGLNGAHPETRELTARQWEVVKAVASGMKNRDAGKLLGTTRLMIANHLRRIYDKVGVWNRLELALWYTARQMETENAKA